MEAKVSTKDMVPNGSLVSRRKLLAFNKTILLVVPATLFFVIFFAVPVGALLGTSFNERSHTIVGLQANFTLTHYTRFFGNSLYIEAFANSLRLGLITTLVTLVLGYPLAYMIARTKHPGRNTLLMILILIPLQIDQVIRAYGLLALLGDNGIINASLIERGLLSHPLPLMYNTLGIVIGLTQITIPFMVLSLIGIIRRIDPALEEAARSLGANRWKALRTITLPLSMPGIVAGSLLVFALTISNFVVPIFLGGSKVWVLPMWIYKLISEINNWQFAAAVSMILLTMSLIVVYGYHRATVRLGGGEL
jgi:putative spermidine/putrescine transport system permease protein